MKNKFDKFIWFDSNLECTSDKIAQVVECLKTEILQTGRITRWHKRYSEHLRLIVINLFNTFFIDKSLYVAYSRDKSTYTRASQSRYTTVKLKYDAMINLIDILSNDLGYIEGVKGYLFRSIKKSRAAKMKATHKLIGCCLKNKLNPDQAYICRNMDEEIIILKTKDAVTKKKIVIEYEDTENTNSMRSNLHLINNKIRKHFIGIRACDKTYYEILSAIKGVKSKEDEDFEDFEEDDNDSSWNREGSNYQSYLDLSKITLKRIFNNGSFEQGGRFYCTWWQSVPGRFRPYIAIDDKPTIEVDYSGIHINLLYLMEGQPIPTDDVYTISYLPKESRKVLKVALQIMINSKNEARALRSIKTKFPVKEYPDLFKSVTHEEIIEAFKKKHHKITKHFYTGIGVTLQYLDSQIAEDILLSLLNKGIVALPVHDSFIVQKEHVNDLKEAMTASVVRRYSQELKLKQDRSSYEIDTEFLADVVMLDIEDIPTESEYEEQWSHQSEKNKQIYLHRKALWSQKYN